MLVMLVMLCMSRNWTDIETPRAFCLVQTMKVCSMFQRCSNAQERHNLQILCSPHLDKKRGITFSDSGCWQVSISSVLKSVPLGAVPFLRQYNFLSLQLLNEGCFRIYQSK